MRKANTRSARHADPSPGMIACRATLIRSTWPAWRLELHSPSRVEITRMVFPAWKSATRERAPGD